MQRAVLRHVGFVLFIWLTIPILLYFVFLLSPWGVLLVGIFAYTWICLFTVFLLQQISSACSLFCTIIVCNYVWLNDSTLSLVKKTVLFSFIKNPWKNMYQFALCKLFPTIDGQLMGAESEYNRETEILALHKQPYKNPQKPKCFRTLQEISVSTHRRKPLLLRKAFKSSANSAEA